jgi:acyl-CoA synthetase (AMP-forming)/AMP-acid ligase II
VPVLADTMRNAVREQADAVALVDLSDGVELTFRELDGCFDRVAKALAELGLGPGDRVAVYQRNCRHWVAAEGGLAKAGMVTVPINVYLAPREVLWLLEHSEARAIFFGPDELQTVAEIRGELTACEHLLLNPLGGDVPGWCRRFDEQGWPGDAAEPEVDISPTDPQRIMYTSATTGLPKGVICPHETMAGSVVTALANQLRDVERDDRLLVTTPLTHVANAFLWAFLGRGARTHLARRFRPDSFCRAVADGRITHTFLAPTTIVMLLQHLRDAPADLRALREGALRAIWYAGSPIPDSVALEAEDVLGPVLNQQYGLTEQYATCPAMAVTQLTAEWHRRKVGSCGRQIVGEVVRVLDEEGRELPPGELGEVAVRCHGRVAGYWKPADPEAGAYRDGWIHTGDVGHMDDDGFLYVKDRKNDMIVSGGLNVYPAEVESVLHEHPAVYQCAVVGVPEPEWLEVPCAVVVRREGHQAVGEDELVTFARERIAHFKAPKRIVFADSLPVTATGKVLRRRLREQLREGPGTPTPQEAR